MIKSAILVAALVLSSAGCGASMAQVTEDAAVQADSAVAKFTAAIQFVRQDIQPYARTAISLCTALKPDAPACKALDTAANALETALQHAEQGVRDYAAGKQTALEAYALVKQAVTLAEDYARAVLALHARQV